MKAHLRLAERQGLLRGKHLSPAQVYALQTLIYLDEVKEAEREKNELKWALTARQEYSPERMFPDYFPEGETEERSGGSGSSENIPLANSSADLANANGVDYSGVTWMTPSENPREFAEMMGHLSGNNELTVEDLFNSPAAEDVEIEWTDWT